MVLLVVMFPVYMECRDAKTGTAAVAELERLRTAFHKEPRRPEERLSPSHALCCAAVPEQRLCRAQVCCQVAHRGPSRRRALAGGHHCSARL